MCQQGLIGRLKVRQEWVTSMLSDHRRLMKLHLLKAQLGNLRQQGLVERNETRKDLLKLLALKLDLEGVA